MQYIYMWDDTTRAEADQPNAVGKHAVIDSQEVQGFGDDGKPTKRANIYILVIYIHIKMILFFVESC